MKFVAPIPNIFSTIMLRSAFQRMALQACCDTKGYNPALLPLHCGQGEGRSLVWEPGKKA